MGNLQSSTTITFPSTEIKWKTGKKVSPIPCPLLKDVTSLDKLVRMVELKDFLLSNIYSDYLIHSLLQNDQKEDLLSSNIPILATPDSASIAELNKRMSILDQASSIGSQVSSLFLRHFGFILFNVILQIRENELVALLGQKMIGDANVVMTPFFRSFQKRIALLRGLESVVLHERTIAHETRKCREYSGTYLNSTKNPQAYLSSSFSQFSLGMLQLIPKLVNQLSDEELLATFGPCIRELANSFIVVNDAAFY